MYDNYEEYLSEFPDELTRSMQVSNSIRRERSMRRVVGSYALGMTWDAAAAAAGVAPSTVKEWRKKFGWMGEACNELMRLSKLGRAAAMTALGARFNEESHRREDWLKRLKTALSFDESDRPQPEAADPKRPGDDVGRGARVAVLMKSPPRKRKTDGWEAYRERSTAERADRELRQTLRAIAKADQRHAEERANCRDRRHRGRTSCLTCGLLGERRCPSEKMAFSVWSDCPSWRQREDSKQRTPPIST